MTVDTPKSPRHSMSSSFTKMLLGLRSLCRQNHPSTNSLCRHNQPSTNSLCRHNQPSTNSLCRHNQPSTNSLCRQNQPSTNSLCRHNQPSTNSLCRHSQPSTNSLCRKISLQLIIAFMCETPMETWLSLSQQRKHLQQACAKHQK